MKKETIIGIILSVLALIALGLLVIYLTTQHMDVLFPSEGTFAERNAEAVILALHESDKVSESETSHRRTRQSILLPVFLRSGSAIPEQLECAMPLKMTMFT